MKNIKWSYDWEWFEDSLIHFIKFWMGLVFCVVALFAGLCMIFPFLLLTIYHKWRHNL